MNKVKKWVQNRSNLTKKVHKLLHCSTSRRYSAKCTTLRSSITKKGSKKCDKMRQEKYTVAVFLRDCVRFRV